MKRYAIYARKSVFREDSISIESQIEMCKEEVERYRRKSKETDQFDIICYSDNGYSGKNTDRPNYQKMMEDVCAGRINKVFVYRLDRISRSVLDFSSMMSIFQQHRVDFISTTEDFDTSSPMGRAMLNICIVFAQLERETIQQRVTDAYVSRSRKGFYMGGKIPYGYKKCPTVIDGVKTSMYVVEPDEAEDVKMIFELYSKPTTSLADVQRKLIGRRDLPNRRGVRSWHTNRIGSLLKNPIYTTNDISMYNFFKSHGSMMVDPIEEYDGMKSLYLYTGDDTYGEWELKSKSVVIAPHQGFIDPEVWIVCRNKLLANHTIMPSQVRNTFLAGKLKCGHCGYAFTARYNSKSKPDIKYFHDSGKEKFKCCTANHPPIKVTDLEAQIVERMKAKLSRLTISGRDDGKDQVQEDIGKIEAEISQIDSNINSLVQSLIGANEVVISYVNENVAGLDNKKKRLLSEIEKLKETRKHSHKYEELFDVMSKWDELSFDDKRGVVALLIKRINIFTDRIEIEWNI
ncbi:MAG: recombinase family protein [Alphaproteobacteria bacterium]|nr:recombinase family protein [Alphaproteobacteria bacterium]